MSIATKTPSPSQRPKHRSNEQNAQGHGRGVSETWDAPNESSGEKAAKPRNACGDSEPQNCPASVRTAYASRYPKPLQWRAFDVRLKRLSDSIGAADACTWNGECWSPSRPTGGRSRLRAIQSKQEDFRQYAYIEGLPTLTHGELYAHTFEQPSKSTCRQIRAKQ